MSKFLYFQSIVQYRINTDTQQVEIVKKFTSPIKGAKEYNKKKVVPKLFKEQETEEFEI